MFLVETLTILTDALKQTFNSNYPVTDFAAINIGIEYPAEESDYPGIWVDFEPSGQLETGGIDLKLYEIDLATEESRAYRKWRFTGYATYTVVALSKLQMARLFDELVKVMAFGIELEQTSAFRRYIEDNPYIAANFDFDQIQIRGTSAAPGTPWGTDEIIYETTIAMECIGEFVSDGLSATLVPLSSIKVDSFGPGDADSTVGDGQGTWR